MKDYRRCVSCRKLAPRDEFWRIVRSHPSHQITIDRRDRSIQGRSAYLCQTGECLNIAQKKNRLGRSLKAKVEDDIYQQLARQLIAEGPTLLSVSFPNRIWD